MIIESPSSKVKVITDDKGNFFADNLAAGKKYTLIVQSKLHKFAVPAGVIDSLSGNAEIFLKAGKRAAVPNMTARPFAQQPVKSVKPASCIVSGRVTAGGKALQNVSVNSKSGAAAATNENGEYSVSVMKGDDITLEPALAGYAFTPETAVIQNVNGDKTDVNFQAEAKVHTLSGYAVDKDHKGVKGVSLKAHGLAGDFSTNAKGFYKIPGMPHKGKITVVPESAKYNFYPERMEISLEDELVANDIYAYPKNIRKAEFFVYGGVNYDVYPEINPVSIVLLSPQGGRVSMRITDERGSVIKEVETDISPNTAAVAQWDGDTSSSESAPAGRYAVSVSGAGFNGEIQEFNIQR
ncbi:MAG: hypothetical protein FWC57_02980 [Endomicrobia bacterium]|nr:hypothetical protein [Endomicrobiia bacterium]